MKSIYARIAEAIEADGGLVAGSAQVASLYDGQLMAYYPQVVARTTTGGCAALGIGERRLATNAALPAILRARQWAEEIGLPCRD